VLDIHFVLDQHPQSLFGVASSTGSLALYRLVDTEGNGLDHGTDAAVVPKVKHVQTFDVTEPSILVTAFMWLPRRRSSDGQGLNACISLTNGSISLVEIQPDSATSPPKSENIGSHDLEAWTIAATIDGMGIYSGGDDSALCLWDVPKDTDSTLSDASDCDLTPKAVWKDRKLHNAGVTAILPLPSTNSEPLLVTGSYDDCVRLISAPSIGRRKELACMNLGGGVWRLKRLNSTHRSQDDVVILASCMHAGARILNLGRDANDDEWKFEVLVKFEEHKSMNYGSDCQPYPNEAGQTTFVTTSFYDRLLCLWRY
jgi:diphthamide biosynthesis protein 7